MDTSGHTSLCEDYVSFETAKLLKEKGFDEYCKSVYHIGSVCSVASLGYHNNEGYGEVIDEKQNSDFGKYDNVISAPTLQMAMKYLEEVYHILVIPDYIYECTNTSWCYKIYKLTKKGEPEKYEIKGVSYDENNNPTEHIVGYRDYYQSDKDYATRKEAEEAGIRYVLENLI